jgi:hypothetical protein
MKSYIWQDEDSNAGKTIDIVQGEVKNLKFFWFDPKGAPVVFPAISELVLKVYQGIGVTLTKKLSLTELTLISSSELSGKLGFQVTLSAVDTAGLPVNSSTNVRVSITNSTTVEEEISCPGAFNVIAPLVP